MSEDAKDTLAVGVTIMLVILGIILGVTIMVITITEKEMEIKERTSKMKLEEAKCLVVEQEQ